MGFSGQLGTVNLADIFQTLHMNRQSGTLTVSGPAEIVRIWFSEGQISLCSVPPAEGRPFLVHALIKKGLVQADVGDDLLRRHRQTGQALRDLLLHTGSVNEVDLDEVSAWAIEEQICPTFDWSQGEFSFEEGEPAAELNTSDNVQMGPAGLQTTQVVMEATRRKDEWERIRAIITDPEALYAVDNDGRSNLRNMQTDPEMLKVLRYLDGQHSLESVAQAVGLPRFDAYAIVAQLVVGGVARARGVAEIVEDAIRIRGTGDQAKARELLEIAARQVQAPEVLRPLAEVCTELSLIPRAVELYLTLIQQAQDAGDLTQALAYLDTVIALSPADPDLQFERAHINGELGNVEAAAQGFVAAAQAYIQTKDVQKAVDACHRAKNLLPRNPDPHRWLARAYLLDGNTETAAVEYKALWHSLLSDHRPRKALDDLRAILDTDCKYTAVKEQVLAHAQNSEAVRTSRAIRTLIYVAIGIVISAGLIAGWWFYENNVLQAEGSNRVTALESELKRRLDAIEHQALREEISLLRQQYEARAKEVGARLIELDARIAKDFEGRASRRLAEAEALRAAGKYGESYVVLDDLPRKYPGTSAAGLAAAQRTKVYAEDISTQVLAKKEHAKQRWAAFDWDGALAELQPLLARTDLPAEIRKDLTTCQVEWDTKIHAAKDLSIRAAALEGTGDPAGALAAWRRAADPAALGDGDRASALNSLVAFERSVANDFARQAQAAATKGDSTACFQAIDRLASLVKDARGPGPREVAVALVLPFSLEVDSRFTALTIQRGGEALTARAPPGTTSSWRYPLAWRVAESVTVTAVRTGFVTQTFTISPAARRIAAPVALLRGPKYRLDLAANPTSALTSVPGTPLLLLGTNRATLELLDPVQGASRPISFSETMAELTASPVFFAGRAYVVLDDRLYAVDLGARARLWGWPGAAATERPRLLGSLAVQEHELIQGQQLLYVAAAHGEVLVLAVDAAGRITVYPKLKFEADVNAQLTIDRSDPARTQLYVPTGSSLVAYDVGTVTERSPPVKLFTVRARGEITGTPRAITLTGEAGPLTCWLVTDSSGLVLALDLRKGTAEGKRVVGSWSTNGTGPSVPTVARDGSSAWVTLAEGRVQCLDLTRSGQLRWLAPAKGTSLGNLVGSPTLGRNGLYIADSNGVLLCLDPQTGATRWKVDLGGTAVGGALAVDGRVLVPLRNSQLVCFEEGEE